MALSRPITGALDADTFLAGWPPDTVAAHCGSAPVWPEFGNDEDAKLTW
ncbi:hypothetical protein [Brucella tritici]|nr:hypothetical protein [Brucella tritici]